MAHISGSVGSYESGAKNLSADVRTVQTLLTNAAKRLNTPTFDPLGIDGEIGRPGSRSNTVNAIINFQRQQVGMTAPDQRVDVNGTTWKKLVLAAGTGVGVSTTVLAAITLTVKHGGQIPMHTKFKETTPATVQSGYESTFTLSGGVNGTFCGSIFPNDMTKYGRLLDKEYPLHIGFHKGGGAAKCTANDLVVRTEGVRAGLLVNARSSVNVQSDDIYKTTSVGINVHNGYSTTNRGSEGCLTLQPSDWPAFIQLFLDGFPNIDDWHAMNTNTGKKIGTLVIKA